MNRKKIIFLSMAIILALGTMMMMRAATKRAPQVDANAVEVLVASEDVPAGQFLLAQNARWQAWPKQHVTEAFILKNALPDAQKAAVKEVDHSVADGDYVGAVARKGIRAGEPILVGQIVKPQDHGFMSAVLNPGMRAIAVPITSVTGIAGFVFPGDHVDLILTHTIKSSEDNSIGQRRASVTVIRNTRVLALDQNTNDQQAAKQPKVAQVVTLEVDPKQAEKVTLALQLGTLSLSLRSLAEADKAGDGLAQPIGYQTESVTMDSDVSNLIPPMQSKEVVNSQMVEVFRGKDKVTHDFSEKSDTNGAKEEPR